MKVVKARALALARRPAGKSDHRSIAGSDQSCSTEMTAPDFSSGANNHSEPPIERPRPASTPSRTPSAALTRSPHRDGRFCRPLAKGPGRTAGTLLVDDSLVLDE